MDVTEPQLKLPNNHDSNVRFYTALKSLQKGTINRTGWKRLSEEGISNYDDVLLVLQHEVYSWALSNERVLATASERNMPVRNEDGIIQVVISIVEVANETSLDIELDRFLISLAKRCSKDGDLAADLDSLISRLLDSQVFTNMASMLSSIAQYYTSKTVASMFGLDNEHNFRNMIRNVEQLVVMDEEEKSNAVERSENSSRKKASTVIREVSADL